jgi:hypothetical protein
MTAFLQQHQEMCALCTETVTSVLGADMICTWENSEKKGNHFMDKSVYRATCLTEKVNNIYLSCLLLLFWLCVHSCTYY